MTAGLSPACDALLEVLEAAAVRDGERTIVPFGTKELARRTGKAHSTVTEQVGRLMRAGLISDSRRGSIVLAGRTTDERTAGGGLPGAGNTRPDDAGSTLGARISALAEQMVRQPQLQAELAEAIAVMVRHERNTPEVSSSEAQHGAPSEVAAQHAEPQPGHEPGREPNRDGAAAGDRVTRTELTVSDRTVFPEPAELSAAGSDVREPVTQAAERRGTAAAQSSGLESRSPTSRTLGVLDDLAVFETRFYAEHHPDENHRAGIGAGVSNDLAHYDDTVLAAAANEAARMMASGDLRSAVSYVVKRLRLGDTSWFRVDERCVEFQAPSHDTQARTTPPVGETGSTDKRSQQPNSGGDAIAGGDDEDEASAEIAAFNELEAAEQERWLGIARERTGSGHEAMILGLAAQMYATDCAADYAERSDTGAEAAGTVSARETNALV